MKSLILGLTLCLLIAVLGLVNSTCDKQSTRDVKTYTINLDLPPRERFKQVSQDYQKEIANLIEAQKKELNLNQQLLELIEKIAAEIDNIFPYPFNEELKGIADASGLDLGDVVLANVIYDVTAWCTGIVTTQANGQLIHGRNLDYNFPDYLKNLTILGDFQQNGTTLFKSVHLAGFIGVVTGHKYKAFTFSINERDQGDWWVNLLFALLDRRATPLSLLTRGVMENATTFQEAVTRLSSTDLIAPAYFIVGGMGPDEGAVITRNQYETVDTWKLDNKKNVWYLLETNYDHWLPPPSDDDRRTPGMKAMNQTTQANINYQTLQDVITIQPVCNKLTVYSVVMSAAESGDNAIKITIR